MPLHIYSQDHLLTVNYLSTTIVPKERCSKKLWSGTSEIDVIIIFTNDGYNCFSTVQEYSALEKIFILCPNNLFAFNNTTTTARLDPPDAFEDGTNEFITSSYEDVETSHNDIDIFGSSHEITSNVMNMEDIIYDVHTNILDRATKRTNAIKSKIRGTSEITLAEYFSKDLSSQYMFQVLDITGMSILECKFECPIMQGETRWFRLKINPKISSITAPKSSVRRIIEKNFGLNRYIFHVLGPYTIYGQFVDCFSSYISVVDEISVGKIGSPMPVSKKMNRLFRNKAKDYNRLFREKADVMERYFVNMRNTTYRDIRVGVLEKSGKVCDIRELAPNKGLPYSVRIIEMRDLKRYVSYLWVAGTSNICEMIGRFSHIRMQGTDRQCSSDEMNECKLRGGEFLHEYKWENNRSFLKLIVSLLKIVGLISSLVLLYKISPKLLRYISW